MEVWKDIKGYEGCYQASNTGFIRSVLSVRIDKNGVSRTLKGRVLKPCIHDAGNSKYYRVTLSKNNIQDRQSIHRLVAETFIPNPYNKEHINHIDNNAENNHVSNLEWCTHSENMIHAQKQGRLFESQSKGGTKAGKISHAKLQNKINSFVGKSIHAWTLISSEMSPRKGKNYIKCQCECGTIRKIESSRFFRGEVYGCSKFCSEKYKI